MHKDNDLLKSNHHSRYFLWNAIFTYIADNNLAAQGCIYFDKYHVLFVNIIQTLTSSLAFIIPMAPILIVGCTKFVWYVALVVWSVPLDVCLPKLDTRPGFLTHLSIFFRFEELKYITPNKMTPCKELIRSNKLVNVWKIIFFSSYVIKPHPMISNVQVIPKIRNILKTVLHCELVSLLNEKVLDNIYLYKRK